MRLELNFSSARALTMLYGCIERRDLYPVACLDIRAQNLEKKNREFVNHRGQKKLEIDYKNLEISEICTDEKSRDLHFSRNVLPVFS
jgi:hypothetical protein